MILTCVFYHFLLHNQKNVAFFTTDSTYEETLEMKESKRYIRIFTKKRRKII